VGGFLATKYKKLSTFYNPNRKTQTPMSFESVRILEILGYYSLISISHGLEVSLRYLNWAEILISWSGKRSQIFIREQFYNFGLGKDF